MQTEYKITEENGKFVIKSRVTNPSHKFLTETCERTFVNFVAERETVDQAQRLIEGLLR